MNPNEARSFADKARGGKLQKRWFFAGTKDLNEECHVEENGCQFEEVLEYYQGDTNAAVSKIHFSKSKKKYGGFQFRTNKSRPNQFFGQIYCNFRHNFTVINWKLYS